MKPAREHLPIYNKPKAAARVPHVEHQRISERLQQRKSGNPALAYIGIGGAIIAVAVVLIVLLSNRGTDAPVGDLPEEHVVVKEPEPPKPVDLMTLIPANAGVFGMIDAKQLAASGMLDSVAKDIPPLIDGVRLDPLKDVDKWLFCATADGSAIALAAQGNFDVAAIGAAIAASDTQTVYKQQKFAPIEGDAVVAGVGVTKNNVLLLGEEDGVKRLVDVMQGGAALNPNSPAAKRAAEISGNTIWLIAMADKSWDETLQEEGLEAGAVKSIAFSGNVLDDGIALKLVLDCKDTATAKYVSESLQEESAMLPIPGITFASEGLAATVDAKIDKNAFEGLVSMMAMMMSAGPEMKIIQPEKEVEEEPVQQREPQPFREYDPWEMREIE